MFRRNRELEKITISPAEVLFSHDSVGMYFQIGNDVNTTCEDIARGELDVDDIPNIRVVRHDNKYYSVDNRRLYIFRVLHILGLLPLIEVFKVDEVIDADDPNFTTKNKGCHIRIRDKLDNNDEWEYAMIYQHCPCKWNTIRIPEWWDQRRKCHRSLPTPRGNEPVNIFHPLKDTNRSSRIHPVNVPESKPVRNLHWNTQEDNQSSSIWSTGRVVTEEFEPPQSVMPETHANTMETEINVSKPPVQATNPPIQIPTFKLPLHMMVEITTSPHEPFTPTQVRLHSLPGEHNLVQPDVATQRESRDVDQQTDSIGMYDGRNYSPEVEMPRQGGRFSWFFSGLCCCFGNPKSANR